jgi:hypothetical protein
MGGLSRDSQSSMVMRSPAVPARWEKWRLMAQIYAKTAITLFAFSQSILYHAFVFQKEERLI